VIYDRFQRSIRYLRVSITDRCNLHCRYCRPGKVRLLAKNELLGFDEIHRVVAAAVALGFDQVRLTGGEPLMRPGVEELVRQLATIRGVKDLAMTTNGVLLERYAVLLRAAGLQRINVSLDTVDPIRFSEITAGGDLGCVLAGIQAATEAGLRPLKLNCVVQRSSEESDAQGVARFASGHGYPVRFIRQMHLETGQFWIVEGGNGGHCKTCNRLRLTSDGFILPCLFNDIAFDVRQLGPEQALRLAVNFKPAEGQVSARRTFFRVGG